MFPVTSLSNWTLTTGSGLGVMTFNVVSLKLISTISTANWMILLTGSYLSLPVYVSVAFQLPAFKPVILTDETPSVNLLV